MKHYTTESIDTIARRQRFIGGMLSILLMLTSIAVSQSPSPVNLRTAGDFVTLAKTGVSSTGTNVTGDIGVIPNAATGIAGFGLIMDPGTFSTSALVTGGDQPFDLSQNYPNPFNPSTTIHYTLEEVAQVSLKVYNLLGQEVATLANGRQEAGSYTMSFNTNMGTRSLSSGVYFYRLEAGSFVSMKRLVLMK